MTVYSRVHFWALDYISLVSVSIFMPAPQFWLPQPCDVVINQEVRCLHSVLSQDCFGYFWSFVVPYKCLGYLFCETHHWYLDRIGLNLYIVLSSLDILMMLILCIYEQGICFHLRVSSLISFFSFLYFSEYRSVISLVKFICRYFIFDAILSGIVLFVWQFIIGI